MAGMPKKQSRKAAIARGEAPEPARTPPPDPVLYDWKPDPRVKYTPELIAFLLKEMSGGRSLRDCCREKKLAIGTVMGWFQRPEFVERYTRAKASRASVYAEKIAELCERMERGDMDPQAARVAIDAYKWILSRILRPEYGDKQEIISSQADHETDLDAIAPAPPPKRKRKDEDKYRGMLQ